MTERELAIQAFTIKTPEDVGQIHLARNYTSDQAVDPIAILPDNFISPVETLDHIWLCPIPKASSYRVTVTDTADEQGNLVRTFRDLFPVAVCTDQSSNNL